MIQMSMGDEDTSEFAFVLLQIGDIRDDIIRTELFVCSKFHSCIHDDDVVLVFDEHALPYLLQTDEVTESYGHFIFFDELSEILDASKRRCYILTDKSLRTKFVLASDSIFSGRIGFFLIVFFAEINREISLHRRSSRNGFRC